MLPQVSEYKILKKRKSKANIFQSSVPITCSMHIWITLIILIILALETISIITSFGQISFPIGLS